ncbi:MAG: hypothetical protein H0T92_24815 [Pyrinomonadaceae bacterium]|nr:hypothetical protein [Pyrinomonadaceae bacterium]
MIVLDEQLSDPQVNDQFSRWYRGSVISINDLRPHTLVSDDAIATLLRTVTNPTFVTINYADFWRVIPPSPAYCVVCLKLAQQQSSQVSSVVRELFNLSQYRTKSARMGCVISFSNRVVSDYCL